MRRQTREQTGTKAETEKGNPTKTQTLNSNSKTETQAWDRNSNSEQTLAVWQFSSSETASFTSDGRKWNKKAV